MLHMLEKMNENLEAVQSECYPEEEREFIEETIATAFFILSEEYEPVELMTSARIRPEMQRVIGTSLFSNHNMILRDITTVPDNQMSPLIFDF